MEHIQLNILEGSISFNSVNSLGTIVLIISMGPNPGENVFLVSSGLRNIYRYRFEGDEMFRLIRASLIMFDVFGIGYACWMIANYL